MIQAWRQGPPFGKQNPQGAQETERQPGLRVIAASRVLSNFLVYIVEIHLWGAALPGKE